MQPVKQLPEQFSSAIRDDFLLSAYHEKKHHTSIGHYGEQYADKLLTDSGYFVQNCASMLHNGDLRVLDTQTGEILQIEVKTAFADHNNRYGFCLRKKNHTSITYSDFCMLICIDKHCNHYIYIIPCGLLNSQFLRITSHPLQYAGKYAPFRVRGQVSFDRVHEVAQLW
jgi:hypothetical protein